MTEVEPPAAVLTGPQLRFVFIVLSLMLAGGVAWGTWVTKTISTNSKSIAVIETNRYTPKDRLQDLNEDLKRFDRLSARIDNLAAMIAGVSSDVKQLKALAEAHLREHDKEQP